MLDLLARHATPLPAAAIARQLGLPRSSTYHLLSVLTDHSFAVHLPEERRFGLGVAVLYLIQERVLGRPSLVTDVGVSAARHPHRERSGDPRCPAPAQVRALYPDAAAFIRRYETGPTSLGQLRSLLTRVRTDGYAREQGSVTPGLASVASAVLDHNEHPVAGIAVTYPVAEATPTERRTLVEATRWCARELSTRVGYRSGA